MRPFRSRPIAIAVLLYCSISILCTRIPLLNYLGYEFSLLIAILSSFIAGFTTAAAVRGVLSSAGNGSPVDGALSMFKQSVGINIVLLILPCTVMVTNALFVKNCSLAEGMGFFVLLPVVSVIFSCSLAFFCTVHYRHAKTMFVLFFVASLGYVIALGYYTPAIFSYNFFYGYFPGFTYDEAMGLRWPLVLFRFFTLFTGAVLVWMGLLILRNTSPDDSTGTKGRTLARSMVWPRNRMVLSLVILVTGSVLYSREPLGFESHAGYIRTQLGATYETRHFRIFYTKESFSDDDIRNAAAEHEFRLKQVLDRFNVSFHGKVESFIYPSAEAKQRLIGAGNTNIAKPWSGQIHSTRQSLEGTLKHELVHVLAAPFGLPVIKASPSTGLVEGLAMALEWDWGNRTLHQYAAGMRRFGTAPDISSLMLFTGFASQSSSVSYVLAGSFCRFLIDTYDIRAMMKVYRTLDYESAFGRSLNQLILDWQEFLDGIPVTESDRDAVDVFFRSPPIFLKVCPRIVAVRNGLAGKKFAAKEYTAAAALYSESYREGGGYEALSGQLASALRMHDYGVLASALDTIMRGPAPAHYLPLFLTIGDAVWAQGRSSDAAELYQRVLCADLSERSHEAAALRLHAIADTTCGSALLAYFLSDAGDTLRLEILDSINDNWIAQYLRCKVLFRMGRYEESRTGLAQLRLAGKDNTLEAFRLKTIGDCLFRLKRFQDAKSLYWLSLNHVATDDAVNRVNDLVDRCDWMSATPVL